MPATPGSTATRTDTSASATPATSSGSSATAATRTVPAAACPALGQRIETATGTAYCQHDQRDGTLRWRPVTDGGGCLNRTMTGTGADGRQYRCARASDGLNYWRAG
ncbi:hypothetical protein [Nakamurella endophytica]|uniref:Uncharacterized protein n=1 Tax=Nakamurella endophytica TaxID=1748367 RepID=A0A917SN04_9ACTN|nr:hypothetical protein [Nakamurella endophytica]GGL90572.1 hypothetical protein GCM10011594_07730 [Nakamurella endophytica]